MLFAPSYTQAGIISTFLGSEASAGVLGSQNLKNSQNLSLLQANASVPVLNKDNIASNFEVNIVSDNALLPSINHLSLGGNIEAGESYSDQISVYVVRKGDSISQVAKMFDVSVNTIRWANDIKPGEKLKEGDVLIILPVSGVKHIVAKGETLKGIAKKYDADLSYVAGFNGIAEDAELTIGDELIIPDAEMTEEREVSPETTPKKKIVEPTKVVSGYFINPVPSAIKTQGIHGHNAVDLAAPIGTPIVASASGKVLFAKYGWNGAYGNMILIEHPNGTRTLYSHLSKIDVQIGDSVARGEKIGEVGNTGRVRASKGGNGAHLHFEVHGAKNPGATGSWAK